MLKAYIKDDFKNLLEYRQWAETKFKNLQFENETYLDRFTKEFVDGRILTNPDWFGKNTSYEEMSAGITQYKSPDLIEKIYSQISDKISTTTRSKIKARKINYNPSGLGVFVFDRAAMGLYRLKEYYSHSHARVVDKSEVSRSSDGYILSADNSKVTERWEERPDGRHKIRTTSKNVFAWFSPQSKEKSAVEMFITCGAPAAIDAEKFLYSGIAAIITAQILEMARIPTRINLVIGSSPDQYEEKVFASIIPVKNYDETLDINLLALLTSDPRFFRYEGFKGLLGIYDHFGASIPSNFGTAMNREYLTDTIEKSGYAKKSGLTSNRFYYGFTFSESEAIDQINSAIEEISGKIN
jgi:hypothetical protein